MTTRAIRNQKAYFGSRDLLGGATVTLGAAMRGSILRDEASFQRTDSGEGRFPICKHYRKLGDASSLSHQIAGFSPRPDLLLQLRSRQQPPPSCRSSASRPPVSSPDFVAVSISVTSKIEVATSALHSKQYFSILPGSSNNSAWRPQAAHCKIDRSPQLSFGPHNIDVSPAARPLRLLVGIAKCGAEPRLFVEDDKQMREEKPRHSEELSI